MTRNLKGRDMLIEGLSSSCRDRKRKWFFLDVESYGLTLQRHYNMGLDLNQFSFRSQVENPCINI